jgi:hypothetical protein
MEFIKLTDWKTGESVYLDPHRIVFIRQIKEDADYSRRTRIDITDGNQVFVVKEDADQITLATGRGFKDIP